MEAKTEKPPQSRPDEPPKPSEGLPGGAPAGLAEAADAKPGTDPYPGDRSKREGENAIDAGKKERSALDFLLGDVNAIGYDVPVEFDVPGGKTKKLVFHIRQMDGSRIIELEDQYRTRGTPPFLELDEPAFNAHLVAEATLEIVDKETDEKVEPQSEEFVGSWAAPHVAMQKRFRFQAGILAGVAARIRIVSGYAASRVGEAERPMRDAVGNS